MPLELTPLDEASLSPSVRKVTSASTPLPMKMSTARGMAPLAPTDLVTALYQLGVTGEPEILEAVAATAEKLPDAVLAGALAGRLDPRVLDFFSRFLLRRSRLLQVLLLNPSTADDTVAHLATQTAEAELELIAQNEQRLLRHPAIITALYLNPRTRMSTATRALELAVRNNIRPEGIPSFDEVKAALESEGPSDEFDDAEFTAAFAAAAVKEAAFQAALEAATSGERSHGATETAAEASGGEAADAEEAEVQDPVDKTLNADDKAVKISQLPVASKVRLATLGNSFARAVLVRDTNKAVALAAIRSPAVTDREAELHASNRSLNDDVIRYIASNRVFVRRYTVKLNLVNNPKCPLQAAMGFLAHLTAKDLRTVSRSKGVPSALRKAAQGLIQKREGKH